MSLLENGTIITMLGNEFSTIKIQLTDTNSEVLLIQRQLKNSLMTYTEAVVNMLATTISSLEEKKNKKVEINRSLFMLHTKSLARTFSIIRELVRELRNRGMEGASLSINEMMSAKATTKRLDKIFKKNYQQTKTEVHMACVEIANEQHLLVKLLSISNNSVLCKLSNNISRIPDIKCNTVFFQAIQMLRLHDPNCAFLALLMGCSFLLKKDYRAAIEEFFALHRISSQQKNISFKSPSFKKNLATLNKRKQREDATLIRNVIETSSPLKPLAAPCIGATHFSWSITRPMNSRLRCIINAFAWLIRYLEVRRRTNPIEAYYNMGRFLHECGLANVAENYYRYAIQTFNHKYGKFKHIYEGPKVNIEDDIRKKCAHNLAHIYKSSGHRALAISVLKNLIVI